MASKRLFFLMVATAIMLWSLGCARSSVDRAAVDDRSSAALIGSVSSEAEDRMEGVLVSAKGIGSTIRVTVVSDAQGRYAFPQARLEPGKYRLGIRATGYDLEDPGVIEVVSNKTTEVNLKLQKTQDLASQMMNAEWLLSVPGTEEQKSELGCVGCHSLTTVVRSRHKAHDFVSVLDRMRNRSAGSSLLLPVDLPYRVPKNPEDAKFAEYLSSINLSSGRGKWSYELETLPRPKGRATKVIMTEYDLPRPESQPHDAAVDREGMVWYGDFGRNYLGRLNPRTGEVKEWQVPLLKPDFPKGLLDIKFDKEGNPWVSLLFQAGIAKFDKKTEQFTTWSVPAKHNNVRTRVGMQSHTPDGTVWFKQSQNLMVHRLDPKTGEIADYSLPDVGFYGMEPNSKGNLYLFGMAKGVIGELDGRTGKVALYPTPTPNSGPRRGDVGVQDRAWFAEFYAGKFGMFDPNTKQIQEWAMSAPYADPYDVVVDKNGEVWAGGMKTDYIFRLNSATGQITEYLLPTVNVNIRRIDADSSTTPVSVWLGENHQAKIARIEPLE